MPTLAELYSQRSTVADQLSKLRADFDPVNATDEQVAQLNDLSVSAQNVAAEIAAIEAKRNAIENSLNAADNALKASAPKAVNQPTITPYTPLAIPRTVASMIERDAKGKLSGTVRKIYGNDPSLVAIGAQFVGALKGDQSCRDAINAEYTQFEATNNTQQNSAGGYLVPNDLLPTLIDLREQYGVIGRTANVINVSAPTGSIPRRTGRPSAVFINEPRTSDIGTGDLSFDTITYQVKPLASFTPVTMELEQDSLIDLSALVFTHAMEDFAYTEDLCAFNGTGTSTYGGIRGIVNILEDSAYAGSTVTATSEDIFADITVATLSSVIGTLPDYASAGAAWFISRAGFGASIDRLKMTAGGNTVQILEGGALRREYGGYPVEISQVLPAALSSTTATTALLFGNMRQSAHLFRKGGILMARSEEAAFMKAHVMYRTMQRFDFVFSERGTATAAGPMLRLKFG